MPRSFLITNKRYLGDMISPPQGYHGKWQEKEYELVNWLVNLYTDMPVLAKTQALPSHCVTPEFSPRKPEEEPMCEPVDLSMKKPPTPKLDDNNNNHDVIQMEKEQAQREQDDHAMVETRSESPVENADGAHSCTDCGKRYSTSSNLARHRQTHRSMNDRKARTCPYCGKVYVSMPAFSMHVRTHSQGCECSICGKSFSRPWLLQGHLRTHTGEKPFKCDHCGKSFADKSNLRAHIQTHSSEKPFECQRCGKTFALKSYLYKHEESSCLRKERASNKKSE